MRPWHPRTSKFFYTAAFTVLVTVCAFILIDTFKARQVKESLTTYMGNLRDMVFMSTYDSLKKGNMTLFKSHLEEIGTFGDVREFSLLDAKGVIHYSSEPTLVKQIDTEVIELEQLKDLTRDGFTTYYFPVETISYCSRCHTDWKVGSINSYYKLTLSRKALDAVGHNPFYYHGFTVIGGVVFLAFIYQLFSLYERRKYEEQVVLSDSVRTFMESTSEPFLSIDSVGMCTFCNQAGLQQLGYNDANDLIGLNLHEAIHHSHANGRPYPKRDCLTSKALLLEGDSMIIEETMLWRADGSSFVAEYKANPIIKNGIISGASITFQDITEKKAEGLRSLRVSHLASLGELAAGVAHEINNPINGVINYAQLYKNKYKTDERGNDILDRIMKEGERVAKIVHSLLHYAHQGSDKVEAVNIVDVITETLCLFQTQLDRDGIHLELEVDNNIPVIDGNFQNLEQVLMNLLSNSRYALNKKYPESTRDDKVLRISVEKRDQEIWPHVSLKVRDQGTGIPEELVNKVMNPFITTKPAGEGTGLGLNVCFNIVKQHNGQVSIDSQQGKYTQVTIDLPTKKQ